MSEYEDSAKREEMYAEAEPAGTDLERVLEDLHSLQALRRKNPIVEARYENLRKIATTLLNEGGPRWYLDIDGVKRFAYVVTPETIVVEVADVVALRDEGVITDEELDRVAPRKVKNDEFKRLMALGRIPKDRAKKIARIVPKTSYVGFSGDEE